MIISEYRKKLEAHQGKNTRPGDFYAYWTARMHQIPKAVLVEPVPFASRTAVYETVTIDMEDHQIKARSIRPAREGKHPVVLMFHDLNREIRGWHHMTRFIALGYGVVALEAAVYREDWKSNPEAVGFEGYIRDALVLAEYARKLDWADAGHIAAWGEGLGGGLAVAAASMLPGETKCCALNPMPADIQTGSVKSAGKLEYCDIAAFADGIQGEVLMGVCLMDTVAPPEGQYAIYNRITCAKRIKVYPKYGHERVNFFENELLSFLHG